MHADAEKIIIREPGYYYTLKQLARLEGCSDHHARDMLSGIREQIAAGRYPRAAIRDGGQVRINYLVWIDYDANRRELSDKNARRYVEAFNPGQIAQIVPIVERVRFIDTGAIEE